MTIARPVFALAPREKALVAHALARSAERDAPLPDALRLLGGSGLLSGTGRRHCEWLGERLEGGDTLSATLASLPRSFAADDIALVAAGEAAGRTGATLAAWARLTERRVRTRRAAAWALVHPALVVGAGCAAAGFVVWHFLPVIGMLTVEAGREVGWPLRALGMVVRGLPAQAWLALAVAALAGVSWTAVGKMPRLRSIRDRAALALPVVGRLLRLEARARTLAIVAAFVDARGGLPAALRQAAAAQRNASARTELEHLATRLDAGETIGATTTTTAGAPAVAPRRRAGAVLDGGTLHSLGQALARRDAADAVARLAERDLLAFERACTRLDAVLPPVLVLVAGLVISSVALATYPELLGTTRLIP